MKVKSESEVAQSCPTLRDPMDYSLPGSSLSPLVTISLFSTSLTLFMFHKQVTLYHFFFLDSTYKQYHVFIFLCLTSLSMTISRYIHVAANGMVLWLSNIPLYISTTSLSILPSVAI